MLEKLNKKSTIIVIGRAHTGTRIIPDVLKASGIYIGEPLNKAHDLLPVDDIYAACRVFGKYVKYLGNHEWDFEYAHSVEIPQAFINLLTSYLKPLIESKDEMVGWKIPNNTLIYPWLVRLLPNATFVLWSRHPEGATKKMTGVDRLEKWNIPCKKFLLHDFNTKIKVVSWKYHYDIVNQTPKSKNYIELRFEDYVLNQETSKLALEKVIGKPLALVELNKAKADTSGSKLKRRYKFLRNAMDALNYD
jgi:hypothetical protein